MSWVLEHLQLIIVIAGAVAYWLNQRAREKAGEQPDYDGDGIPEPTRTQRRELTPTSRDGTDPEADERLRRIQDDIRRKIAERRGQASPPPLPVPDLPPVVRAPVFEETAPPIRRRSEAEVAVERDSDAAYRDEAALERQRQIAAQLLQLEADRREAQQRVAALASVRAAGAGAGTDIGGGTQRGSSATSAASSRRLASELRDPRAVRRALALREILGAPVALR
jgi:hypothetical protein